MLTANALVVNKDKQCHLANVLRGVNRGMGDVLER